MNAIVTETVVSVGNLFSTANLPESLAAKVREKNDPECAAMEDTLAKIPAGVVFSLVEFQVALYNLHNIEVKDFKVRAFLNNAKEDGTVEKPTRMKYRVVSGDDSVSEDHHPSGIEVKTSVAEPA